MPSVVAPEWFLTLILYLSSDKPFSLILFSIESLIIMTSFLLSILELLRDEYLDDALDNDSDSDDDVFWFWLLFEDRLSDLFWLFKDDNWNCDVPWLSLVSPLLNLIRFFWDWWNWFMSWFLREHWSFTASYNIILCTL